MEKEKSILQKETIFFHKKLCLKEKLRFFARFTGFNALQEQENIV